MGVKIKTIDVNRAGELYSDLANKVLTTFELTSSLIMCNSIPVNKRKEAFLGFYETDGLQSILSDACHESMETLHCQMGVPFEKAYTFFSKIEYAFQSEKFEEAKAFLIYGTGKLIERPKPRISEQTLRDIEISTMPSMDRIAREQGYALSDKNVEIASEASQLCDDVTNSTGLNNENLDFWYKIYRKFSPGKAREYMHSIFILGANALINMTGKYETADAMNGYRVVDASETVRDMGKALRVWNELGQQYVNELEAARNKYGFSNKAVNSFRAITPKRVDFDYFYNPQINHLVPEIIEGQAKGSLDIANILRACRGKKQYLMSKTVPEELIQDVARIANESANNVKSPISEAYNYAAKNPENYVRWLLLKTGTLNVL